MASFGNNANNSRMALEILCSELVIKFLPEKKKDTKPQTFQLKLNCGTRKIYTPAPISKSGRSKGKSLILARLNY